MYTQPFSELWLFDRCQEGSIYLLLFTLLGGVTGLVLSFRLLKKKSSFIRILLAVFTGLVSGITFYAVLAPIFMLVGLGIFNCTAHNSYWPVQNQGKQVAAELYHRYYFQQSLPKNEAELRQQIPLTIELEKKAAIRYSYYPETNTYSLVVRPSLHAVSVYDPRIDNPHFSLNRFAFYSSFVKNYPPNVDGEWLPVPRPN